MTKKLQKVPDTYLVNAALKCAFAFLFLFSPGLKANPCTPALIELSTKVDATLVPILQDLAHMVVDYQKIPHSVSESPVLQNLIYKKMKALEATLESSRYTERQKTDVKAALSEYVKAIGEEGVSMEAVAVETEREHREEEKDLARSYVEDHSEFAANINKSIRTGWWMGSDRVEYSHDDKYLIVTHGSSAFIMDPETGNLAKELTRGPFGLGKWWGYDFQMSMDRKSVLYLHQDYDRKVLIVYEVPVNEIAKDKSSEATILSQDIYKLAEIPNDHGEFFNFEEKGKHVPFNSWNLLPGNKIVFFGDEDLPPTLVDLNHPSKRPIQFIYHQGPQKSPRKIIYEHLVVNPDRKTVAISHGLFIGIYDLKTGAHLYNLNDIQLAHERYGIAALSYSHDGAKIVAGHRFGFAIWDLKTGKQMAEPFPPLEVLGSGGKLQWSPDDQSLAIVTRDNFDFAVGNRKNRLRLYGVLSNPPLPIMNKPFSDSDTKQTGYIQFSSKMDRLYVLLMNSFVHVFKRQGASE